MVGLIVLVQACLQNESASNRTTAGGTIETIAGKGPDQFGNDGDGGSALSAKLGWLTAIAAGPDGSVYIADGAANVVRKINLSTGGKITTVAGVFIGFNQFDPDAYDVNDSLASTAHLNVPLGIAVAASGNIFIADAANNVVRKINVGTGIIKTVAGSGPIGQGYDGDGGLAIAAKLWTPYGVAVDKDENLFIVDAGNHVIRRVDHQTGIITTVAGSGQGGYAGDNAAATAAKLRSPKSVALDASGNLYIADCGNHVIRKVNASNGVITTVAGNGVSGLAGDGAAATAGQLNAPHGLTVDSAGNLYIADEGNHAIRMVSAIDGKISTVAGNGVEGYSGDGGSPTMARLRLPSGVTIVSGALLISDGNSVVRRVNF